MKVIKIKLHSIVDLITNSSTTIFTYSQGSLGEVKSLINEMLKVFEIPNKTADDLFYFGVFADDYSSAGDRDDDDEENGYPYSNADYEEEERLINDDIMKILKGEMEKPKWMIDYEETEDRYNYFTPETSLHILPKDEKYSELANKLLSYLNSQHHEACQDG